MKRVCKICRSVVKKETHWIEKKKYPWYCPECEAGLYNIETEEIPETEQEYRRKVIHYLTEEDYLPLNADMVRSDEKIQTAINSLLADGIIRMINCEGAAVELNTAD